MCSGVGQSLTLIAFSSELSEMTDKEELYRSYYLPHNNQLTPDTVSLFAVAR